MEMGMSFGHRLQQSVRIAQSLRLSLAQRCQMQMRALSLRLELVVALRGDRYEPKGTCPKCGRRLTPVEILRGFNQDPNDYTTRCTSCGRRFEPILVCANDYSTVEIPFFCPSQTLAQLEGMDSLAPNELLRCQPAVYHSAILHHGGLRRAFAKIGVAYAHDEIADWKEKVKSFLGRLPDTIIAECVDVPVRTIRTMRRQLGIPRFTTATALQESSDA